MTMLSLMLRCLGAFEVTLDEMPITGFPTDKIRAFLAYLALEQAQPHRREALSVLFWSQLPPAAAQNNLRVTLYRLRDTLEKVQPRLAETLLISNRQTVHLNPHGMTVDAITFQTLLTDCATHQHADRLRCDACITRFTQATELYRGELLAGLSMADAPAFEEWLLLRRETLHQQALAVLHTLVQAHEQRGNDLEAHRYASRQLALDPYQEEAHRQIMRILARRGLRTEALAQYETCCRLLREQLNVAPDLETMALVEQIRAGKLDKTLERQGEEVTSAKAPLSFKQSVALSPPSPVALASSHDWNDVPEISKLYGRQAELGQLVRWLVDAPGSPGVRLVALLGIGGVGKTTLAATVAKAVALHFDQVLWRSLLNAPPLDELLHNILQRLAEECLPNFPTSLDVQLALLLDYLRQRRCLLVLDNLESILDPDQPGQMRPGYGGYAQLLQTVAERSHQSCLLLTSRERPQHMEHWEEDSPLVRTLVLEGLDARGARAMLTARGLTGPAADAASLVERYSGNPLALKLVAQTVQELFGGDIAAFLATEAPIFADIRMVLDQQFARLSQLEQELLLWLAVERIPVTATALCANLVQASPMPRFLEALRALQRRSLLENSAHGFTLQNVVIEYLTEQLIERVCQEILDFRFWLLEAEDDESQSQIPNRSTEAHEPLKSKILNRHALFKAQASEYIRQSQIRVLLQPVAVRLLAQLDAAALTAQIGQLVTSLQQRAPLLSGYAAGNLLNLLIELGIDLSDHDFSGLCLWQAYLRGAYLPRVNLAGADLTGAVFTHSIGIIQGWYFPNARDLVALSFNGEVLGLWRAQTGELIQRLTVDPRTFHVAVLHRSGRLVAQPNSAGTIDLIDVARDRRLHTLVGAPDFMRLVFSPDGQYVATGHADGQIFVWAVASGHLCAQWQAHPTMVTALAFAPDNQYIASGTLNGLVALWQVAPATLLYQLTGHTDQVMALSFTPDGALLVSGSHDCTARLWETASGCERSVLQGHTHFIRHLAIAPNGRWLVTGGVDRFIYLWDLQTGKIQQMLTDHAASVEQFSFSLLEQIAFSPDSEIVVAYDVNATISLWAVATGQRLDSYRLHHATMNTLAFSPDGRQLIAGGADCALYLWDVSQPSQAQVIARLAGHRKRVSTVAFSPDGEYIASGDFDGVICLRRIANGINQREVDLAMFRCQGMVRKVVFSPDGQTLASASDDGLRLWSVATGQQTYLLPGPTPFARKCAFSPDGRWLAGVYLDQTICLWAIDAQAGYSLRHTMRAHTAIVEALLFSPDSRTLFSSGWDSQLCRWDVQTGALQTTWLTQTVYIELAIHPDGQRLATGGGDPIIRLLAVETGQACGEWRGHSHAITALDFTHDGRLLASASHDNSIRLWDVVTGVCLQTLRTPGPYAGMNIVGVTGISEAEKVALRALGAVEE